MERKNNYKKLVDVLMLFFILTSACNISKSNRTAIVQKKPNIIFILADDLGYADVGFNGQTKIQTPAIDQLAKEGMVFTNHYAGSTVCGPSRGSLLTGLTTGHSTIRGNPGWTTSGKVVDLEKDDITVGEELKRAGYRTAVIGKWGLAAKNPDALPARQGFDYFYGFADHAKAHHYYPDKIWINDKEETISGNKTMEKKGKYSHDEFTKEALQYIRNNKDNPFFLYLAYTIPHFELTVPEDSKEPYKNLGWPVREMKSNKGRGYQHDKDGHLAYAGMVSRMDRDISRIMNLLKELNLDEETVVIFTSDNGPEYDNLEDEFFNSNGSLRGKKRDLYEGGIRVPFVIRWPGKIKAGSTSDHISAFWDFLPTACELAGIQPTGNTDGISYLPTLLGNKPQQKEHAYLYWEFNEKEGPIQAIRKGNWKAVKFLEKPMEIYNLASDPGEEKNIASSRPDLVKEFIDIISNARTYSEEFQLKKLTK